MKNRLVLKQYKLRLWKIWVFSLFILLLFNILLPTVGAQNENAEQLKDKENAEIFVDKVKKNLAEKYSGKAIREVTSFVKKGLHGGKIKSLYINGEIKPKSSVISMKKEHGKAREIAIAFLIEEGNNLFDVADLNDLHEFKALTSKDAAGKHNFTHLYFNRYVWDLRLDDSYIHITVKDDDSISSISANVVPVSKEMLKAVKSKTLTEEDIKKIVEDDLQKDTSSSDTPKYLIEMISNDKEYPRFNKIEKLAIPESPYVVYSVEGIWIYTIDAFTGKILKKLPTVIVD